MRPDDRPLVWLAANVFRRIDVDPEVGQPKTLEQVHAQYSAIACQVQSDRVVGIRLSKKKEERGSRIRIRHQHRGSDGRGRLEQLVRVHDSRHHKKRQVIRWLDLAINDDHPLKPRKLAKAFQDLNHCTDPEMEGAANRNWEGAPRAETTETALLAI